MPTEYEFCEILGVSRNVLREAIKALEIFGIIKSKQGVGIILQEYNSNFLFQSMFYYLINDKDELVKEIFEIRAVLETGFLPKVYQSLDTEDIKSLRTLIDTMKQSYDHGISISKYDIEFHKIMFSKVDNKTLKSIFKASRNIDESFESGFNSELAQLTIKHHDEITSALETRDYPRLQKAMQTHFDEKVLKLRQSFLN